MSGKAQVLVSRNESEGKGGVPLFHVTVTSDNQEVIEAMAVAIRMIIGEDVDAPSLDS